MRSRSTGRREKFEFVGVSLPAAHFTRGTSGNNLQDYNAISVYRARPAPGPCPGFADKGSSLPFGTMSHATTELARERPAQINITIRNPNTNASAIASLM